MKISFPQVQGSTEIYMDVMRAICGDTKGKSMVDLCSNLAPHTPLLGFARRLYVDILPRRLDLSSEQQYFRQHDVLRLNEIITDDADIDVTICSDGIEHFTKPKGYELLEIMEMVSRKQILFTPLGEYMVDVISEDPEGHHSGWVPEDVKNYAAIVFPDYHPTLGVGAFFFLKCEDLATEWDRITRELIAKPWGQYSKIEL